MMITMRQEEESSKSKPLQPSSSSSSWSLMFVVVAVTVATASMTLGIASLGSSSEVETLPPLRSLLEPVTAEKGMTGTKAIQGTSNNKKPECKCAMKIEDQECCERHLGKTHKMGWEISKTLFGNKLILQSEQYEKTLPTVDYRYLLVTRNWYESLVSGYLYHKTGRECWLDPYGRPPQSWYRPFPKKWAERFVIFQNGTLNPPPKGRDICNYLKDESEEAGLRAYMDTAWGRYYGQLVNFWRLAKAPGGPDNNRTIHMCFEDLSNITLSGDLVKQAYQHLLLPQPSWLEQREPRDGGNKSAGGGGGNRLRRLLEQWRLLAYEGGHATDHDPELRGRLKKVIAKIDAQVFNNTYAKLDEEFGCGVV